MNFHLNLTQDVGLAFTWYDIPYAAILAGLGAVLIEGKALQFLEKFVASMNSYLGMMIHYRTYKIRRKVYENTNSTWWQYVYMANDYKKFVIKKQYRPLEMGKKKVKSGEYKKILMPELY